MPIRHPVRIDICYCLNPIQAHSLSLVRALFLSGLLLIFFLLYIIFANRVCITDTLPESSVRSRKVGDQS